MKKEIEKKADEIEWPQDRPVFIAPIDIKPGDMITMFEGEPIAIERKGKAVWIKPSEVNIINICKEEDAIMEDKELANKIRKAVDELNALVSSAAEQGIEVKFSTESPPIGVYAQSEVLIPHISKTSPL